MFELTDGREVLYQWDTGRTINVDGSCTQLHFSNVGYGVSVDVDVDTASNVAKIPDALLTVHGLLYVYGFIGSSGNGYTKISQIFDVKPRPKPADYVYTEDELKTYEELEAKIEEIDGRILNIQTELSGQIEDAQNELSGQIANTQTELVDIRVAADGTTYETAGEAVRAQVSGLNDALIEKTDELKGDLAGKVQKKDYAPETKTESMTQPVGKDENGKLWTTVPDKISAFENDAGYLTEHQDISGKLDADKLQEAVNYALEQAKISGEFDGADGRPGENGTDGYSPSANVTQNDNGATITITDKNGTTTATVTNGRDGQPGADGNNGQDGKDGENYVLTDADKQEIANIVAIGDIPEYWQAHLNERVEAIRRAMESAGRNKSSFFFYSDAHWANENTYTSKIAPTLLKYLHKKTPINKTNFGGDIVFGEGSSNTDTMEYLWDWREQLRDLPNHHSVIGNHDDGHGTNDRILSKEYIYSYLLAPEENNDIVWGGDFYYYIDDKAENTRYLYLDVFYEGISSSQKEFVKEAIKTVPAAWHIVAIGHAWFANDYSVYPPVLNGFATEVQDLLGMFDRYNAREGEFAECGGWVELCIGGHYHLDHYEHTTGGIPVIIVEADTFHDRGGTMPTHGNTSESAVSAVVVDYYDKIVKVIRVGRGESYEVPINRVSPPNYTNVIPLSIDKDGTPFANGKGWMANSRIGSGGIYAGNQTAGTDSAQWVTGHIEINPNIDNVIRLKNVTFQQNTSNSNHGIAFFDSSFSRVVAYGSTSFIPPSNITKYGGYSPVLDSDTNILEFTLSAEQHLTNKGIKYIAICCGGLSDDSIITINELIE